VGLGWVIAKDDQGAGAVVAQGSKTLPGEQVAFDAEITAIEETLKWFRYSTFPHLVIHSDSTSAIARESHSGARPGQRSARAIRAILANLQRAGRSADIQWVKGHAGIPGNWRADVLAGRAVEKTAWSKFISPAHLKLRISEKFRATKDEWQNHHGSEEIPPPAKKSCFVCLFISRLPSSHPKGVCRLQNSKRQKKPILAPA
jgi:ribonuclease HI